MKERKKETKKQRKKERKKESKKDRMKNERKKYIKRERKRWNKRAGYPRRDFLEERAGTSLRRSRSRIDGKALISRRHTRPNQSSLARVQHPRRCAQ